MLTGVYCFLPPLTTGYWDMHVCRWDLERHSEMPQATAPLSISGGTEIGEGDVARACIYIFMSFCVCINVSVPSPVRLFVYPTSPLSLRHYVLLYTETG